MKRALTAAVFSGLFVFAIPQAAFADHAPDHSGDCGAKTEQAAEPDGAPQEQPRQGDREQEHSDGSEILF